MIEPVELLPCPFCGERPAVQPWSREIVAVTCRSDVCPAVPQVVGDTRVLAFAAWNTRKEPRT